MLVLLESRIPDNLSLGSYRSQKFTNDYITDAAQFLIHYIAEYITESEWPPLGGRSLPWRSGQGGGHQMSLKQELITFTIQTISKASKNSLWDWHLSRLCNIDDLFASLTCSSLWKTRFQSWVQASGNPSISFVYPNILLFHLEGIVNKSIVNIW